MHHLHYSKCSKVSLQKEINKLEIHQTPFSNPWEKISQTKLYNSSAQAR